MLLLWCGGALDETGVAECWEWIEAKVGLGQRVVALFDDAASCTAVTEVVTPSSLLTCLHATKCTSTDDFVVLAALYAVTQSMVPVELLRFTSTGFESLSVDLVRASHLHQLVHEVNIGLSNGDASRAKSALGLLRPMLQACSGTLSAEVFRRAGDCKLLIDACRARNRAALQDGSLLVRSRLKPIETWSDLFPLLDMASTISALAAWPEVTPDLQRLHAFVNSGSLALNSDVAAVKIGKRPTLSVMLWLTAYLVRTSEHYLDVDDGAAALTISVCALDTYINLRLFEYGFLVYDHLKKDLQKTPAAKALFAKYNYGDGVKGSLMVLTDPAVLGTVATGDVEEVIHLRNHCIFTHGVQRLSVNDARDALTRVKTFIKAAETKTPAVGVRWNNLHKESFVIDWAKVGSKTFAGLIA